MFKWDHIKDDLIIIILSILLTLIILYLRSLYTPVSVL